MEEKIRPKRPRSLLLVRLGGLGDLLAVLPCIRFLKRYFPGNRLTLVCREEYGGLFQRAGLVDEVESQGRPRFPRLYAAPDTVSDEVRSWLAGFDLVLAWIQGSGGKELEDAVRRHGRPALILNYDPQRTLSVSRGFFEATVRAFETGGSGLPSFEECSVLPVGDDVRDSGRDLAAAAGIDPQAGFILIHPGAGSRKKRWPIRNFLSVASRLSGDGRRGLIITGEAEEELRDALTLELLPAGWRHLDRPVLAGLAGLLSECELYIGNDSGITHLAAACGARVLALFRAEFADAWRPAGRSTVVCAKNIDALTLENVLAAVRRILRRE